MTQAQLSDPARLELVAAEVAGATAPCVTSSFQAECVVLRAHAAQVAPDIPVLFLDTVHHFPQTLAYRDEIASKWGLNLITLRAAEPAPGLWQQDLKACCGKHKVRAALRRARALRHLVHRPSPRAVADPRRRSSEVEPFTLPTGTMLRKVSPLAHWTHEGRLGVRQGARDPAAAALRSRLHQHRLRAVHDAPAATRQRALRPLAGPEAGMRDSFGEAELVSGCS